MELRWSSKAVSDLDRLHDFLAAANPPAAARAVQSLVAAPKKLIQHPRLGERLDEFAPREIRRLLIGAYEMRYEIQGSTIFLLRIWHTRENRLR
ncbi:type II toxin-antitoxin system RelE/ParE family toxin [Neorhizobium sp. DT-125]|uniref:type II toxin-antitoxin system RelE/ParE family toxin n=1 Tax=Neorhizobium sp. DT-125 TaxID=3396163 RepID=UPI003F1C2C63